MSLASRLASSPNDAYWALSTADAKFPKVTLSNGEEVTVSYGQYRAILATRHEQADREKAFTALHETYKASLNTYATLYNAVCQRDWFQARARGYKSTLEAALHGDNIPTSVVENLIETTRAGVAPLRRYHQLRRRMLKVPSYQRLRLRDSARHVRQEVPLRGGARLDRRRGGAARRRLPGADAHRGSRAAGSTSTRTKASGPAPTRRRSTGFTRTCSSTTPTRWMTCSRRRTRWGTRCTPSCRTRRSRSSIRTTRSSSPRCRPR